MYHVEPVNLCKCIERVDEGTSNLFKKNEMLDMLNELEVLIENEEAIEEGLEIEMTFNGEPQDTINLFEDLMNEARNKLYSSCLEYFFWNFLVKLMHIKVLNVWSNKCLDMLLGLLQVAFSTSTTIPTSFYEAK